MLNLKWEHPREYTPLLEESLVLRFFSDEFVVKAQAGRSGFNPSSAFSWDYIDLSDVAEDAGRIVVITDEDSDQTTHKLVPQYDMEIINELGITTREIVFVLARVAGLNAEFKRLTDSWQPLFFWKKMYRELSKLVPADEVFAWSLLLQPLSRLDKKFMAVAAPHGFDRVAELFSMGADSYKSAMGLLTNDVDASLVKALASSQDGM